MSLQWLLWLKRHVETEDVRKAVPCEFSSLSGKFSDIEADKDDLRISQKNSDCVDELHSVRHVVRRIPQVSTKETCQMLIQTVDGSLKDDHDGPVRNVLLANLRESVTSTGTESYGCSWRDLFRKWRLLVNNGSLRFYGLIGILGRALKVWRSSCSHCVKGRHRFGPVCREDREVGVGAYGL